jgi:hypothetical protein
MLKQADMSDRVRRGLAILEAYIRIGQPLNLTDANLTAELFVQGLLNRAYGWQLRDLNAGQRNYPCLDLLDDAAALGIQISASRTSKRANDTLLCLRQQPSPLPITVLKLFTLVPKQGKYTISASCPGVRFNPAVDVLDFQTVLKDLDRGTTDRLEAVHSYIVATLPQAFASEASLVREQAKTLRALLTLFDRAVLYAPASSEDPVAMLRSLRELRLDLQRRGALRFGLRDAALLFKSAVHVLHACELQVQHSFPHVARAAQQADQPEDGYPTAVLNEYSGAIQLMMDVRAPLTPILTALDAILAEMET